MSLSTIRTQLKTLIGNVSGINSGNVFDYDRLVQNWDDFLSRYQNSSSKDINAWMVTRESTEEKLISIGTNPKSHNIHKFVIKGFYSLDDSEATEKIFEDLIESIRSAIRDEVKTASPLSGEAFNIEPAQLRISEQRPCGHVMCHYAEITVLVTDRV